MTMTRLLCITAVLLFAAAGFLYAGGNNLQKMVQETQKWESGENVYRLIWWIPTEYWKESFKNEKNMSPQEVKDFCNTVDEYIVVCVVDATLSPFGSISCSPRESVKNKISIKINEGPSLKPLSETDLSGDAQNLFSAMKPIMANMLGQLGKGMEFFCFKAKDANGKKLLNPKEKGLLTVSFGKSSYKFRLPLGSLLPPKYDPETGEEFPGNYIFNPYTGKKLIRKPLKSSDTSKAPDSPKAVKTTDATTDTAKN
jgi:hypothetical protein